MLTKIENNSPSNRLRIEYMLGNFCNYKCNYCFPGSNEGTVPWPNIDIVKENLSHLLDQYRKINKTQIQLYLIGGEPTVWKDLPEFCNFFKTKYSTLINISTNGSRSLKWWKENSKYFDQIEISVHHEYAKLDHLIKVSDIIYESNVFVNCNVLFDYGHFDKCKKIVEELSNSQYQWPINAKTVNINGQTFYNDTEIQYLENSLKRIPDIDWYYKVSKTDRTKLNLFFDDGSKKELYGDNWIILNNMNQFFGWKCNIGVDFIKVFQDGTIKSNCNQILYNLDYDFNLYDKDFKEKFNPRISPLICQQKLCECGSETAINKQRW